MANGLRMRVAVHNLSDGQIGALRDAYAQMMAIRDNRGYGFLAGLHGTPGHYCWHHQQNARSALQMRLFLPWHRAYLYNFEMAARSRVADVTIPWWDWTLHSPRQTPIPEIFNHQNVNRRPNPLFRFRINLPSTNPPINRDTERDPAPERELPNQGDIDEVMSNTDWADFEGALEDLHDRIHSWVSGDMGIIDTAAYDPIFWSHHAMIDRLWWLWQARNGNGNITPDLLDVVLAPFNFRVRDVLNANSLGYDYAAAQSVVTVGGT
jgi:tyrosinase